MMRVPQFLSDQHVHFETLVHPPAFTAQKRAHVLHVPGRQLAKSVLLASGSRRQLAVLPATSQVDLHRLCTVLERPYRLANDEEVAEVFRDCEWGVRMPFGTLYGISTTLDNSFDPNSYIIFESHLHAFTIRMYCRDYERLERPRRVAFSQIVGS